MSCESLKNEQNPDILEEKARLIYEDYISILSPKEVREIKKSTSLLCLYSYILRLLGQSR